MSVYPIRQPLRGVSHMYHNIKSSTHLSYGSSSPRAAQQGAALLVVLVVLVIVMLAGVMTMQRSSTDLKLATSDQINTLLLQAADSGNQKLEAMVNANPNSQLYKDITSASGAIGHFLLSTDNQAHEFIYCYNPREKTYLANNASVRTPNGSHWSNLQNGYCDYNEVNDYTSARQTSMAQMSVALSDQQTTEAFGHMVEGKEVENRTSRRYRFAIRATAALPAYAEPSVDAKSCFEKTSIANRVLSDDYSVIGCMREAATPSKMLYQQADVANLSSSTTCIGFGKGTGTLSSKCILTSSGR